MRIRIVAKLFLLTTALCMAILAVVVVGQTFFFKYYYVNQKVADMKANLSDFEARYSQIAEKPQAVRALERTFHQNHRAWVAVLDQYGRLKYMNNFYLKAKVIFGVYNRRQRAENESHSAFAKEVNIPLYYLKHVSDVLDKSSSIFPEGKLSIYAIKKGSTIVPYIIAQSGTFPPGTFGTLTPSQLRSKNDQSFFWENDVLREQIEQHLGQLTKENRSSIHMFIAGRKDLVLPDGPMPTYLPVSNQLLMHRIKSFQAKLLLDEINVTTPQVIDYQQNGVRHKIFIKPVRHKDGHITYIFSMMSLQPVGEAIQMMKNYYIYMIGFILLLILLASFYFSRKIAKPLLRINHTTRKVADLDFSERVPVTTKDEIGDLSHNINQLSDTLQAHIEQLQHDIDKERQLEQTRKAFISGVSHELKTPLSIMKSCMSILKDDVARHKKDHYFKAVENEVDHMDELIVDMLDLAKLESGTYHMTVEDFYMDALINSVYEQLSMEIAEKSLNVYLYADHVQVSANRQRIGQVLTNLLTNAIRYTPSGSVVVVQTTVFKSSIKISVDNHGTHINEYQLEKIWHQFYRGDSARSRSEGGTGLGLYLTKNILTLHHATYGVMNTDEGVQFYFYLPKAE